MARGSRQSSAVGLITLSPGYEALANDDATRQQLYRDIVETIRPYEDVIDRELVGA